MKWPYSTILLPERRQLNPYSFRQGSRKERPSPFSLLHLGRGLSSAEFLAGTARAHPKRSGLTLGQGKPLTLSISGAGQRSLWRFFPRIGLTLPEKETLTP